MSFKKRLILNISYKIPQLPVDIDNNHDITVKRLRKLVPLKKSSHALEAFFLDIDFIKNNVDTLKRMNLFPSSILLWNPEGSLEDIDETFDKELICQEVYALDNEKYFLTTVRNMYRSLYLERELKKKEEALQEKEKQNRELLKVGVALSAERDNDKLLNLILKKSRDILWADAGSLYQIVNDPDTGKKALLFKIAQNDSNPTDFSEFIMPLNKKSIAGYVASTAKALKISDVYEIGPEAEYSFNKSFDKSSGYRTKSVLTVPMKDHKNEIIGVVQLINKKRKKSAVIKGGEDADKYVVPFTNRCESLVFSLASQAAVSLENNLLYHEIEALFEGFVTASVTAIEQRDPTTSGHSYRVAAYTVSLAKAVEREQTGLYRDVSFSHEQIKEIRYAGLLHDFGKVGVREHVLVKAKKLYPDQLRMIRMRAAFIRRTIELEIMRKKFELLMKKGEKGYSEEASYLEKEEKKRIEEIVFYLGTIETANEPTVLSQDASSLLDEIVKKYFIDIDGQKQPFLAEDEYTKLKIKKGSLDKEERTEIESHVTHTYNFLKTIPWTREMRNIPLIAYGHHERLNGEGYPRRVGAKEIPIQTRMMTISDIYDALTARDRPYKKAVPVSKALDILSYEVADNHIDSELVKIFLDAKIYREKDNLVDKRKNQ
ncbi:MAG: GAF domain-containing protein [Spirochaetes bacterium]|nr:GAF domain-containing protein [Spirochaetota bacterium]